jgi:Holliday junction resolvase-like predicted endonuclease
MSEFLLLSVYSNYLESQGFEVEYKAKIRSGVVDILAKSGDQILVAEAKWITGTGDVYEAIGRCVQNKIAKPKAKHVLVLPIRVTTEEIREQILAPCYKHSIEIHYVDINRREVFPDFITTKIFPAISEIVTVTRKLIKKGLSRPQAQVAQTLLSPFLGLNKPLELVDDINAIVKKLNKALASAK